MFCVTEAEATMIRTAIAARAAAVELRRLFRGIGGNEVARECVRTIVGTHGVGCRSESGASGAAQKCSIGLPSLLLEAADCGYRRA